MVLTGNEQAGRQIQLNQENGVLHLQIGEETIFSSRLVDLFSYSLGRPWKLERKNWEMVSVLKAGNKLTAVLRDSVIQLVCDIQFRSHSLLECRVEFVNSSKETVSDFMGCIRLDLQEIQKEKITIPHVLYNDNPSADPQTIVPHLGCTPGEGIVVEEHRTPIPAVNGEWKTDKGYPFLTLFSLPQMVEHEDWAYGSLGAIRLEKGVSLVGMSGPLMFNGMKDVVYGGQGSPMPFYQGYRTLKPGEGYVKSYLLDWGMQREEGRGFRSLVQSGYQIFQPSADSEHSLKEMIRFKQNVMDSRFHRNADSCGYLTFGSANSFGNISGRPEYYLYAWTGQSLKLAWSDCLMGMAVREDWRFSRGFDAADFFVKNSGAPAKGLHYAYYLTEEKVWKGAGWDDQKGLLSSRMEGESLSDLLDIMKLFKSCNLTVPPYWESCIQEACTFLMSAEALTQEGLYPSVWREDGRPADEMTNSSGIPCVLVLAKAYEYFGDAEYLECARKRLQAYYRLHVQTFERPFARSTMDAKCEDKEAGLYFFLAAYELYKITKEGIYQNWAEIGADWILTFVYFWNTGFKKGSLCRENGFSSLGWPGVSVQNHHLDVFFPVFELYDFGCITNQEIYKKMAANVRNALTHGVSSKPGQWGYSVLGEQGEQYYQTNYFQLRYPQVLRYLDGWRGGMQRWNPSWITAQVLQSSLYFRYFLRGEELPFPVD